MNRTAVMILVACCVCAVAPQHASAHTLYGGLLAGYTSTTSDSNGIEPYGLGLGASAGVTLPVLPLYLGARFIYDFGDSANVSKSLHLKANYVQYGVDLGYDFDLDPFVFRPGLGIGRADIHGVGSVCCSGAHVPVQGDSLYLAPGASLLFTSGLVYLSAEVRYNALTEKAGKDSVSLLAGLGITL